MAMPAAGLSKSLRPKGSALEGSTQGCTKWRALGIASPCPAHALHVAPRGLSGDQLPGGHWSRVSGAAQPTSTLQQHVSPWATATETSPGVRSGSGLGLNVAQKWYRFPHGRYSSLRMAFLCIIFSGIALMAFPPTLPHSREQLDQMHHWVFTLMSFVL